MKQPFRILLALPVVTLFAIGLSSCGEESQSAVANKGTAAPANEIDAMINDYEKVANEYIRVANRLKGGDMSVTIRYIDLEGSLQAWLPKFQQVAAKMTPAQTQKVSAISVRTAPYVQK